MVCWFNFALAFLLTCKRPKILRKSNKKKTYSHPLNINYLRKDEIFVIVFFSANTRSVGVY